MKKILSISIFLFLIMFPQNVKANSCSYTEQALLRKRASNIMPSYTYIERNDNVKFNITFTNMSSDLYIYDKLTNTRYDYNGTQEITIYNYDAGVKAQFEIYTTKTDCSTKYLAIKYVNLPSYNKYYKDPLCEGKENISVCNKWNSVNITYEEFKTRVNSLYNDSIKEETKKEEIKTNVFDMIYNFLHEYYVLIIIALTIITFTIMYIKNKKNNYGF